MNAHTAIIAEKPVELETTLWTDDARVPVLAKAFRDLLTIGQALRLGNCETLCSDPIYFVGTMWREADWFGAIEHGPRRIKCNGNSALQSIMDSLAEIRSDWIGKQGGTWHSGWTDADHDAAELLERETISITDALDNETFKLAEQDPANG